MLLETKQAKVYLNWLENGEVIAFRRCLQTFGGELYIPKLKTELSWQHWVIRVPAVIYVICIGMNKVKFVKEY